MDAPIRAVVAHGAHDLRVERRAAQFIGPLDAEIDVAVGGICGSDLHYFHRGGVGDFTIREPLILGHEIVGTVAEIGSAVEGLPVGTRVAVDPSSPCGECAACLRGARNLCTNVRFLGSAARTPHVQGGFRNRLVVGSEQCVPIPDSLDFQHGVFAEPLAVAVHAAGRAGPLLGRRVLVTGAGPIGALIVLVAKSAGAASITVTDVVEGPLEVAHRIGATETVNVAATGGLPEEFDVAFEASGAPAALATCVAALRRGGRLVLVGLLPPGTVPISGNRIVTTEIEVVGSFRFVGSEFRTAVDALVGGLDVTPLITASFPLADALAAFEVASERNSAMKVQLSFGTA